MKKRILLVDDEKSVLDGLKRTLHSLRSVWDMVFVSSGEDALEELSRSPFDVIVSDMRMPGMDGSALLEKVRQRYPDTVRLILSGQADQEAIIRAVGPAQQFLSKPCQPQILQNVIHRAIDLRDRIADPTTRSLVGKLATIPTPSKQFAALSEELLKEEPCLDRVANIVARDIGLTCKILQIVNSSFFGISNAVTDVKLAACLLGLQRLKPIFLTAGIFSEFKCDPKCSAFFDRVADQAIQISALAAAIVRRERPSSDQMVNQALLAGLVLDAGQLILAAEFESDYLSLLECAETDEALWCDMEVQSFGVHHAHLGAYLLGLWGFSAPIVEAVAFHHRPGDCVHRDFGPLTAVHAASALIKNSMAAGTAADSIDRSYLESIGCLDRLEVWKKMANLAMPELLRVST